MMTDVVVVAAEESARLGTIPDQSMKELHAEALHRALDSCGLTAAQIDGLACAKLPPQELAYHMGSKPSWFDGTNVGGCSYLVHVRHAVAAIRSGYCEIAAVVHGESGRSNIGQPPRPAETVSATGQFESPYGAGPPATKFTLPAMRYMKETGIGHEELAAVAVVQRRWASLTTRAAKRELITVDDVLSSPMIAYPFHRLECCLRTDGGGAVIVTTAERAAGMALRYPPVKILGSGEALDGPGISMMEDLLRATAFQRSSAAAFTSAGVGPAVIDHLMVYDAFAHLPLYGLEALGFVDFGDAGGFVSDGHTGPGGSLPMNTNGGGLSYTHTGMYGMFAMLESIRQVQGRAEAQVTDVEVSMTQAVGGMFAAAATLIFGRQ